MNTANSASMRDSNPLRLAVEEWRNVLAPECVTDDSATVERYARTTQSRGRRPGCVLYPASTEQVQAVVRVAAAHGIVVHPISRGKNWGYTDACPTMDGAAIVDLSRMNRIIEVNRELAYAVIEAGVSQGELHSYLQEHCPELWMDSTGAGLSASVVGNILERGFGHTRYGDRFLAACGMDVVLADGRLLRTGFGHYGGARAAHAYRYGVGPALDGLFCQSNLGIVTQMGVWLQPAPEAFECYYIIVPRAEDLTPLVDRLRPLRMAGILPTAVHIANDLRIISAKHAYPWDEAGGETPLPEAVRARLRAESRLGAWQAAGALMGPPGTVAAGRRALKHAAAGLGRLVFMNDTKLALANKLARLMKRFGVGKGFQTRIEDLNPCMGC
jgi:4-cresol dehydrogenase (hydroxylating) flavoprotein subunit